MPNIRFQEQRRFGIHQPNQNGIQESDIESQALKHFLMLIAIQKWQGHQKERWFCRYICVKDGDLGGFIRWFQDGFEDVWNKYRETVRQTNNTRTGFALCFSKSLFLRQGIGIYTWRLHHQRWVTQMIDFFPKGSWPFCCFMIFLRRSSSGLLPSRSKAMGHYGTKGFGVQNCCSEVKKDVLYLSWGKTHSWRHQIIIKW